MRPPARTALAIAGSLALLSSPAPASAQALKCSTFLHNRDGSWTSFWDGVVFGSYGPVPIRTGERFRAGTGGRARNDVARLLDQICASE